MNNEKINLTELIPLIVQKSTQNKDTVNAFLKALFPIIEEGLRTDGLVKINGFGTFKLLWNEARKSVDVNTGAEIIIEGYNKITFIPDNSIKEKINEPFAHLEAIPIGGDAPLQSETAEDIMLSPLHKLDEQVAEIKDLLADINDIKPREEIMAEPVLEYPQEVSLNALHQPGIADSQIELDIKEPKIESETEPTVEETKPDDIIESEIEEPLQNAIKESQTESDKTATKKILEDMGTQTKEKQTSKPAPKQTPIRATLATKKNNTWKLTGIVVAAALTLFIVLYLVLQNQIEQWVNSRIANTVEEVVIMNEPQPEETTVFDMPREYTDFITTEKLTEGSRLAWLSQKYYGSPYFWVYIYEANQDVIPDPNNVLIGTVVRVPKLPASLIDANSPDALGYARKLHEKYVK